MEVVLFFKKYFFHLFIYLFRAGTGGGAEREGEADSLLSKEPAIGLVLFLRWEENMLEAEDRERP